MNRDAPAYNPDFWNDQNMWSSALARHLAQHHMHILAALLNRHVDHAQDMIRNLPEDQRKALMELDGNDRQVTANCLEYALNILHTPEGELSILNMLTPGELHSGQTNFFMTPETYAEDITAMLEKDKIAFAGYDLSEIPHREGYYLIAMATTETKNTDPQNMDYHFYRQDKSGLWSHKAGPRPATNLDEGGNLMFDPAQADRGNYTNFQGFFYVPGETLRQTEGFEHPLAQNPPYATLPSSGTRLSRV